MSKEERHAHSTSNMMLSVHELLRQTQIGRLTV